MHSGSVKKGLLLLLLFVVPGVLYLIWYLLEGHWGCSTCGSRKVVPIMDPDEFRAMHAESLRPEGNLAQGLGL